MRGWCGRMVASGLLLLVIAAWGALWSAPSLRAQELAGDVTNGKILYQQHCLRCHGASGWGDGPLARDLKVPPANFHGPILQMKSDDQLLMSIEFGVVMSPMHAWRGRLSDQEMQDVVAYVRLLGQRGR